FELKWDITRMLQDEIKIRLASFWFQHWVVDAQAITVGSPLFFYLIDITKIISYMEHFNGVAVIETIFADLLPTFWFSAVTGRFNAKSIDVFEQFDIMREQFPFDEYNISALIEFIMIGAVRGARASASSSTVNDLEAAAPFNI